MLPARQSLSSIIAPASLDCVLTNVVSKDTILYQITSIQNRVQRTAFELQNRRLCCEEKTLSVQSWFTLVTCVRFERPLPRPQKRETERCQKPSSKSFYPLLNYKRALKFLNEYMNIFFFKFLCYERRRAGKALRSLRRNSSRIGIMQLFPSKLFLS